MAAGVPAVRAVRAIVWLCVAAAATVRSEPHGASFVRKGDGAPWGHYFNPGYGGYYTVDDFRPEPQTVVHLPALPEPYEAIQVQQHLQGPDYGQAVQGPEYGQSVQGPEYGQAVQGPEYGQAVQGPDYGQSVQGPDYGQATQGPDYGQVTQGPDLSQETQGPEEPQVQVTTSGYYPGPTNQPDDVQYTTSYPTTPYPTTPYPTTPYPTTPYPTTGYPTTDYPTTTDYPHPTTWRPRPEPGTCRANPAAAGYPRGTQLICTVELCPSAGGVKGGGVKGGGVKGGGVKGGGVKGGGVKGGSVKGGYHSSGYLGGGYLGSGLGTTGHHDLAATLVCRPFLGCDEPVQTTETPEYTTPGHTVPEYTTPGYTTPYAPEETTPAYAIPEYTTPVPTLPPPPPTFPPPPPTLPPAPHTPPPGVKGGHRPPGVKGHGSYVDQGVKGGVQHKWEPEPWSEGVKGVKGVKGGRRHGASANVPAYGYQWGDIAADMDGQWGLKTHRRPPIVVAPEGVKDGHQHQHSQQAKGRPAGYQLGLGGWGLQGGLQGGHHGYQGAAQDQRSGVYLI